MNELVPDANRANDARRLDLIWYGVLPGAILVGLLALYGWMQTGAYARPAIAPSFQAWLPAILAAALVCGIALAVFMKLRLPDLVARHSAEQPFQRVSAATFVLLGAAEAPTFIGVGLYLMDPVDWMVLAIGIYAVVAGVVFKPDFNALLAMERR